MRTKVLCFPVVFVGLVVIIRVALAEDTQRDDPGGSQSVTPASTTDVNSAEAAAVPSEQQSKRPAPRKLPEPQGARRLLPDADVWVDPKEGAVIVDGVVCLREGMLEMFACTRNSKEHESIVSVSSKAWPVHAGLLAVGAVAGHPVQFVPEYKPPAGTEIDVLVQYINEDGNEETVRAQDWIKDIRANKSMEYPFVFGGSVFWTDPDSGKKYYQAERGDFICVSNFGTAMLDIPVKSSAENDELAFMTFTERIPRLGTPVRLILKPKLEKKSAPPTQVPLSTEQNETNAKPQDRTAER